METTAKRMMTAVIVGALTMGHYGLATAESRLTADSPIVAILFQNPAGIPRDVLAEAQAVASGIYAAAGVKIVWTEPSPVPRSPSALRLTRTGVIAMLGPFDAIGQFTWMSRDGRQLDTVGAPTSQLGVELSPSGHEVATFRSGEIWTMNVARPVPRRITLGHSRHPIWSPDGSRMLTLFQGRGLGSFDLVITSVATSEPRNTPTSSGFRKADGLDARWTDGMD